MMQSVIVERSYPYIIGVALGAAVWFMKVTPESGRFDSMVTAAISVSAILLGFLGTAKAMLLTFRSTKFTWMKKRPRVWQLLIGYFKAALTSSFVTCLASLVLLGVSSKQIPEPAQPFVLPIWLTLFAVSVSTFYRVVAVFFTLLNDETPS